MHESFFTHGPAGVVAGRHVLQADAVGLHVLDGQGQQLLHHWLQVGSTDAAQVSHQGKRALPHIWKWILQVAALVVITNDGSSHNEITSNDYDCYDVAAGVGTLEMGPAGSSILNE